MKRILITGATGGIGSELVKLYASHNYFVLAFGTNVEKLNKLNDKYKEKIPGLFCNYSVRPLYEKDSNIFFTYNNYPASSNKNGMFVYQMKKESANQC